MWLVVFVLGPLRFWLILAFVKKMTKTRQQHNYCIYTYTTFITLPLLYLLHLFCFPLILHSTLITNPLFYGFYTIHYYILYYVSITVLPLIYSFICLFVIYPITIHLSIYIVCFPLSLFVIYRQFIILNLFGVSSLCSELILFDSAVYIAFCLFCLCIKRFWLIELICFYWLFWISESVWFHKLSFYIFFFI